MAITYNDGRERIIVSTPTDGTDHWAEFQDRLFKIKPGVAIKKGNIPMSTEFEIDLGNQTLRFGGVADGEIGQLEANINLSTERSSMPYSGLIKGDFIGEIKNVKSIPLTIPHQPDRLGRVMVFIIGAGGTGGYVIRDFVRYIHALKEKGDSREFVIKVIDADVVEEKNILRQNFIPRDLGKNKAEVQAERYSNAFGVEMEAITEMLTAENARDLLLREYHEEGDTKIIVGCVDNHEARRAINQFIKEDEYDLYYWIDSGNERKSGQVVCGFGSLHARNRYGRLSFPTNNTPYQLPNVTDIYPEILDSKNDDVETTESCADRAVQETQNIFVNMFSLLHHP